ncbi:MAG: HAD family hydrolase [Pseudomonadota bacterium]
MKRESLPVNANRKAPSLELVLFDFGGVLAEEGFRNGLFAIAEKNALDAQRFFIYACEAIVETGYLTGRADEKTFWELLRSRFSLQSPDSALRNEILTHFTLRAWMIDHVKRLRGAQVHTALLSDQTNWLKELDAGQHFFSLFDRVFNSYDEHKSKLDPTLFDDVLHCMHTAPDKALFIDDNEGHIGRARQRGLHAIVYRDREDFELHMAEFFPLLAVPCPGDEP